MKIGNFGKAAASLSAFAMLASPAVAATSAQAPRAVSAAALPYDKAADRGWGNSGWGSRWNGGWGRRHHDDGISAGDVFAGVLVIGAIAAIASSASKKDKREREQDNRPDNDDWRYGEGNGNAGDGQDYGRSADVPPPNRGWASDGSRGISLDTAVDTCVADVERGSNRVDTVDNVNRDGEGWRIEGRTQAGASWNCTVDGSGRVKGIETDDRRPRY